MWEFLVADCSNFFLAASFSSKLVGTKNFPHQDELLIFAWTYEAVIWSFFAQIITSLCNYRNTYQIHILTRVDWRLNFTVPSIKLFHYTYNLSKFCLNQKNKIWLQCTRNEKFHLIVFTWTRIWSSTRCPGVWIHQISESEFTFTHSNLISWNLNIYNMHKKVLWGRKIFGHISQFLFMANYSVRNCQFI